jgi:flagellar biosynthesis/type III secretory pathway protein FliH
VFHELLLTVPRQLREVVLADSSAPLPSAAEQAIAPRQETAQEIQARKAEQEALQRLMSNLEEVATELQQQQSQRLEEMRQVAVELAVAIASRLVHERIEAGDYAVETLIRQAVESLKTTQPITIYLHPQDLALLENRLAKTHPPPTDLVKLRLVGDPLLGRGDCRAEAGDTGVLAQVQEQLVGIRKHLLEKLPEATLERRRPLPADRPLKRFPDRRHTA